MAWHIILHDRSAYSVWNYCCECEVLALHVHVGEKQPLYEVSLLGVDHPIWDTILGAGQTPMDGSH